MLFNIYMKPLGEVIRSHQYAGDTQFYLSFTSAPGEAVAVLNRCLAEVIGWMRANKLSLNPDKTEVLLVGGDFDPVMDRVALPLKDRVHSLGVLLDPELSLEFQVVAVARSAFLQLRLIHQLCPYLNKHSLATVIHALVTSHLDYCNPLYVGLPLKTVRILQLVQNIAARLLTGTGRYSHITPILYQLHRLPVEVQAQFRVLVLTYKALNSLGPGYLKEHTSTSTTGTSHLTRCDVNKKGYCVNGGECFMVKDLPNPRYLCKCPNEFTGDRCQNYVMASFYKTEELYQKRVLTITGICIALLVVGIMCVVAYCKTKKQRKKLHDRLRQGLRSERNHRVNMANGPHHSHPPPENVQLVNQYVSKNVISSEHAVERETETSFSTSHYTSTTHHSTTVTQTPSHRYVSAMTTPARMSPVDFHTPSSPKSPASEMSPQVSSLTMSVPSVAVSPFIEEERPLLLVTPPRLREKYEHHMQQFNSSYHHNPTHESNSLPPSPLRIVEDEEYETTQEYEPTQEPPKKLVNSRRAKRTKPNGHISNRLEMDTDTSCENSSSESETEDERIGEDTPFLSIQNPMAADLESATAYRLADTRTNQTSRFSTQEELQARLSSVIANQDPIAV
ncbi:Pro-neuregulin-1, membrane-bound isoform [Varanus komodoensis]|nr:Pro-neuregulin-1, membrane-bound isoform [Varanus komodoensis]